MDPFKFTMPRKNAATLDADALRTDENLYDGILPLVTVTEECKERKQKNNSVQSAQSAGRRMTIKI